LPGLVEYVQNPRRETTFYLSGLLDPAVFNALRGYKVELWFPEMASVKWPGGLWMVGGGTTTITRAPFLARLLGWRDLTIYGADSSFEDNDRYAYEYGTYGEDSKAPINLVYCNGEGPFRTELCLAKQVAQLGVIAEHFNGSISFRCKGLLDAYLR